MNATGLLQQLAAAGHCVGVEYSVDRKRWYAWASPEPAAHLDRVPVLTICADDAALEECVQNLHKVLQDYRKPGELLPASRG